MASWLLTLLLSAVLASADVAPDIRVVPESETFTAVLSGNMPGAAAGPFAGSLSVNGSPAQVPVRGIVRSSERSSLSVTLRYQDVPEDWVNRFRSSDFDYRLRGRVAGAREVEWSGTARWDRVQVERREDAVSGFVKLGAIEVSELSLFESAGRAEVVVRNPLSFPLRVASSRYGLFAQGRQVGSGATGDLAIRAGQATTLNLPIDLDHGQLLAAFGSALRSGGEIEGRLRGALVVRLAGAEVSVPIDLSGRFSFLR